MTRDELTGYIDHTLLRPDATTDAFEQLCAEAVREHFGCVCVAPGRVGLVARHLAGSPVHVCSVIDFPHGASTIHAATAEARQAIADGAVELDIVMPIGRFLDGDDDGVVAHLASVINEARTSDGVLVKVIIETGLLDTTENKTRACELVIRSGAHYVKTSTGFNAPTGATVDDVRLLHRVAAGRVKVKASGGIGDLATALTMIEAGADRLGCSRSCAIMAAFSASPSAARA